MSEIESTVEDAGGVARKVRVSVPAERCKAEFDKAYDKLRPRVQLQGFRKGKVPRAMLESHYGDDVRKEVIETLIETGLSGAVEEHHLHIAATPRLVDQQYDADSGLVFEVSVELRPEFELSDYSGRSLVRRIVRVGDAQVDRSLEGLRERMAVLENEVDRDAVEQGDIVVFDMFGFDEDENPVPGTEAAGVQIEVGEGKFGEDFESQLVGVVREHKAPVSVSYPDEHANEDLRGRTVRFDVTVREIKRKVLPDVDDDFARDLGIDDCDSLDDLRGKIREDLAERAVAEADRRVRGELLESLVDGHEFDVPQSLVDETVASMAQELGAQPQDEEQWGKIREALEPRATKQVKAGFLLDAVVRAEEIEVDKAEVEERVRMELAAAGPRAEEVRKHYSSRAAIADLANSLAREKAVRKLVDLSTVTDQEIDESEVADQG